MTQTRWLTLRTVTAALLIAGACLMGGCAPEHPAATAQADGTRLAQKPADTPEGAQDTPVNGEVSTVGEGEDAITVLTVWGTPYEMGYAHGKLCGRQATGLYTRFIMAMCIGMKVKPDILDDAWEQMEPFVSDSMKEEMKGLADGSGLDIKTIHRVHAIPDLSEFHCTFFAAWGDATKDGNLHQIRALDYATEAGIQNEPALIVQKPNEGNAFVNVGWLGFVGVVSGMNEKHIAVSEIGEHFSDEVETLAGEPMPFVMRRALEEADDIDAAVDVFKNAHRTSSYLYCIGDGKIPEARALRTSKDFCEVYGPSDHGDVSLENVVYWSMGCDSGWNKKVYDALSPKVGQIDETVGMIDVMKGLGTGDLHAVHYDATDLELWVANATTAPENAPAFDQGFVHFSLADALD